MLNKIAAGVAGWFVASGFTRDMTVAYIGVPMNIIVACSIGAMCSFGYGDPVKPRSEMFAAVATSIFMGAAFTGFVNALLHHSLQMEMLDGTAASLGAIVSFAMRPFLPWAYDTLRRGRWVRLIPFFRRNE